MLICLKMIYSQSDEKGILDVLEIKKILCYPTMVARYLNDVFKIIFWFLPFGGGISISFLKKEKKVKVN